MRNMPQNVIIVYKICCCVHYIWTTEKFIFVNFKWIIMYKTWNIQSILKDLLVISK